MVSNIRINKEKFIFWIIIIDILFFPYFNVVVVPYSYFIIAYMTLKNFKLIKKCREIKSILFCMFLMLGSTIIGCLDNYQYGVVFDNVKRLIQYYFAFGYYFYFKLFFNKYRVNLKNVLIIFILFVFSLAVIFNYDLSLFSKITTFWNPGNTYNQSMLLGEEYFGVFRYNFIWTDPNNIAYALTGVVVFIFMQYKLSLSLKIFLLTMNVYVLISSMSSGGWINFVITFLMYFMYRTFTFKIEKTPHKIKISNIILFILLIYIIFASSSNLIDFLQSDIVTNASDRFANNENTRTQIWMNILNGKNIFSCILFGMGSEIYINGASKATHSGHLYWIYAYGFVSYLIFMKNFFYITFKKLYLYIPIVSFFLCFTMNTMIGEQKLFVFLILFITYIRREGIYSEKS